IGNAARHGVLIKGGVHLEEAGRLNMIAFDKTGTLTKGTPEVTNIIPIQSIDETEVLKIATAIEAFSQHPIASSIMKATSERQLDPYEATSFQSLTGKGAQAKVNGDL